MKKLLIALVIAGTAMSAMAQLLVLDVKIQGIVVDGPAEPMGTPNNEYSIEKGQLKGWLVTYMGSEEWQDAIFIMAEKGGYEQVDDSGVQFFPYQNTEVESETKSVDKGIILMNFGMEFDGMELSATTIGKYIYTETEADEKLSFVTKGAGGLSSEDFDGYIKSAKFKLNAKLTEGINNSGSWEAAEAFMEEFIAKIVKDEVDLDFESLD